MHTDSAIPQYVLDSVGSLPPLPCSVQRLLTLSRDADVNFDELAAVIEMDQTLTARTLRAANSALYGAPRRVSTVSQAIIRLGRDTLTNLALSISFLHLHHHLDEAWPLDADDLWRHNIAVAAAARMLARHLSIPKPDEAFVAGLLHDIGKLVMVQHFGVVYGQVVMAAQHGTEPLHLLEREVLDLDHTIVGHALCMHWNIPPPLMHAVAGHHNEDVSAPDSIAEVVRDANDLVKMLNFGHSGNAFAELRPDEKLSLIRIRPADLRAIIRELPAELEQASATLLAVDLGADRQQAAARPPAERPIVHLQITLPEERRMLVCALFALGLRPILIHDELAAPEVPDPVAFITDLSASDESEAAAAQDIPVLDFAAWRAEHNQPSGTHFNVRLLHTWLHKHLPQHTPQQAASGTSFFAA